MLLGPTRSHRRCVQPCGSHGEVLRVLRCGGLDSGLGPGCKPGRTEVLAAPCPCPWCGPERALCCISVHRCAHWVDGGLQAAFKAWQRRQAAINARVAAHRKPNIDWGAWASEGSQYDEAAAQAAAANMDPARRKIANLAAAAARAARLWRSSNQGARVVKGAITESSMSSMDA